MNATDRSVVLFDGVCNLCNAWVRWLVERDPDGRFHYASLQSDAARNLLSEHLPPEAVEALPDSIVLVDGAGVHTRSTAALRIVGKLRLPWRAFAVLRIVPRPLRDSVYGFIATRRYRWFGHRDACALPSPDVAQRFLDAGEDPKPVVIRDPEERDEVRRAPVRSWALRFVIAYLVLYMLPFPLSLLGTVMRLPLIGDIPGLGTALGWIPGAWGTMTNALTTGMGRVLFDLEVRPAATGSGDQTFNYVEVVSDLTLALVASLVWSVAARGRRVAATTFDVSRVLTRYYLGWYLLIYGWIKIFPLQMPPPGPDRLLQPYGDSSPMGIAWTFIGASIGYQIFSGLAEAVAGYLLFWRRTALLGSLVAMAVMLNVMAINYFYDVPVKLFSTHLFLCGLYVAAPDLPRLVGLFGFNLPVASDARTPFWKRLGWSGRAVGLTTVLLVGLLTWFHVQDGLAGSRTRGVLAETPALEGIYVVESFVQDGVVDRENEDDARWVRVGVNMPSLATIQRATGVALRMLMAIDTVDATVSFYDRGGQPPTTPQFEYREPEEGVLGLEGIFEGKPTSVVMRKAETDALLVGRGFRWINEFPFNR